MSLRLGLIGSGFMGKAHALAYGAVGAVMGDVPPVRLELLCDAPAAKAEAMAAQFGFARATDDWRVLIADPEIDIVAIAAPNRLHCEVALAALAAGRHVHCEKPMGLTLAQAEAMTAAASAAAGVRTMVGYNYLHNPAIAHAHKLIAEGAIGRIVHFRGAVDEDYQADPDLPWSWRSQASQAGLGALGDLGCHLISLAHHLLGPVASLVADMATVHETRPLAEGGRAAVENEDLASALLRFRSGVQGVFTCSRAAWGRKNRLEFEVHGERGAIAFDQERMNELKLFQATGPAATQGFTTILSGPAHAPYGAFVPAPGHQLGFNELKLIEVAAFLRRIAGETTAGPDFATALHVERVIHAIARSAREDVRVEIAP